MEGGARTWAGRGALVVAALAAIATSPARWSLAVPAPPTRPPTSSATLATVEASQLPMVMERTASGETMPIAPLDELAPGAAWPGRAEYLVPAGRTLDGARLIGVCSNPGMCSGACAPPPDAFLRFGRVDAATEWTIEVESAPQSMTMTTTMFERAFDVAVEATRRVAVTVQLNGNAVDLALLDAPLVYDSPRATYQTDGTPPVTTKLVSCRVRWDAPKDRVERAITWTAKATIRGYCPGANDTTCKPPEGQSVRLVSIVPRASQ